jgi:ribonuclease P protein component
VAREGKRIRTEHLELRAVASSLRHPRIGFVVPKHGQTSVARNRLKRRLREIVRCDLLGVLPPIDVVIRTRREAYAASFTALREQLDRSRDRLVSLFSGI